MPIEVKVPELGESVKQATLLKWHKTDGQPIKADEPVCELETDKANVDIPAPGAGVLHPMKKPGDLVNVGEVIAQIESSAGTPAAAPAKSQKSEPVSKSKKQPEPPTPAPPRTPAPAAVRASAVPPPTTQPTPGPTLEKKKDVATVASSNAPAQAAPGILFDSEGIHRAAMSKIRKRIAQNLLQAQQTAAILTTFNEIDLTSVIDIRSKFKDRFQEIYGVALGFMSFFSRATVLCLKEFPKLNAFIDGDDVVYHQFVNLGIAVSTDRGLAVPVLRHAEKCRLRA